MNQQIFYIMVVAQKKIISWICCGAGRIDRELSSKDTLLLGTESWLVHKVQ
jgi:hypothetical protein